jgi:Flp pilus assembly protein TadG
MFAYSLIGRLRRFCRREDGNVAIEAAIIFPVGFLLVMGTMEMALYFFASSALNNAVKEMAYFAAQECPADAKQMAGGAIVCDFSKPSARDYQSADTRERKLKGILTSYSGGLIRLDAERLCIRVNNISNPGATGSLGEKNNIMRYDFLYRWTFFTPLIGNFFGDRVQFNASFLVRNGDIASNADRSFGWNNSCPGFASLP